MKINNINDLVKDMYYRLHYTQKEIAEHVGMSIQMINAVISGTRKIRGIK